MDIVDSKKALLLITLSLKMSPKEYHHSGDFTFCFVPFVDFRSQNRYGSEWGLTWAGCSELSIETLDERGLWGLVLYMWSAVFDFKFLCFTFDKKAPEPVNYYDCSY